MAKISGTLPAGETRPSKQITASFSRATDRTSAPVWLHKSQAPLITLRAFPEARWKKNCYRIPVEQGTKVLVRTKYYYGNYDGKDSPPEFTVHYDSSEMYHIVTDSDLISWSYCEVVYVTTKKQGTDICFVRTNPDQDPFVSTIEVSRLPNNMYHALDFKTHTLFMIRRFAFGANHTIEYPHDAYNRRWKPNSLQGVNGGSKNPVIVRRKSLAAPNTSRLTDDPPPVLFQAAAMAPMVDNRTAGNLTIRTSWLSSTPSKVYFSFYYAEVESQSRNRTFMVFMDGKPLNTTITLMTETGFAQEFSGSMYEASNQTAFDLVPTKGSILPPIISGMVVFLIHDAKNGTFSKDVEALSMLQSNFTTLQNWTGDPCLPEDYNWEWLNCSYDNDPIRINRLNLSGYQLSGSLPDFGGLDALEDIDLSNNNLTGPIPDFLASLSNLQSLDLSNNDFDAIPASLANDQRITLNFKGNPKLDRQSASSPSPAQGPKSPSPAGGCPKLIGSRLALLLINLLAIFLTIV